MTIDLAALPAPALLEELDFEDIYARKLERFKLAYPGWSAALESEPVVKLLQLAAYDELMYRARVNDVALSRLLAFAQKGDLDQAVALLGVERLTLVPADPDADPPIEAVYESDDRLRWRGQMALERLSVAGSAGAYRYHALSASAAIADVSVDAPRFDRVDVQAEIAAKLPAGAFVIVPTYSAGLTDPMPGDVVLNVLPVDPSPERFAELLPLVEQTLSADTVRPITDNPRARAAEAVHYRIKGALEFKDGVVADVAYAAAMDAVQAATAAAKALAGSVSRSLIYKALHVDGVKRVVLEQPAADVMCGIGQFPVCDGIEIQRG